MIGNPHVHAPMDVAKRTDPGPFLSSFRAQSVRLREFERLTAAAARGVEVLGGPDAGLSEKPVVRRSPDRCVIQFGPVALTLAWLRHTLDSAAEGELLVVVWRGVIASRSIAASDRTTTICTPIRSATVLWEEVLQAVAVDEPSWLWRPAGADIGGYRSSELAARCVGRLQLAACDVAEIV